MSIINNSRLARGLTICLVLLIFSMSAKATMLRFKGFTTDSIYWNDPRIDLYAYVSNGGGDPGLVSFEFHNDSTIASSIRGIYFEAGIGPSEMGTLLDGIAGFEFGEGTLFREAVRPANLPGGRELSPAFHAAYNAGSVSPVCHNGIGPGQQLTINLYLAAGATYNDLLDQLAGGILRVGLHVIALPDDSSFSAIPEPATIILFGLGAIAFISRAGK